MRKLIRSIFFSFLLVFSFLASCAVFEGEPDGIVGPRQGGFITGGYEQRIPSINLSFPWPPPLASATEVIPRKLLQEESKPIRLTDVANKLADAIRQNGYYESRYRQRSSAERVNSQLA
jgi:hypothetical protein